MEIFLLIIAIVLLVFILVKLNVLGSKLKAVEKRITKQYDELAQEKVVQENIRTETEVTIVPINDDEKIVEEIPEEIFSNEQEEEFIATPPVYIAATTSFDPVTEQKSKKKTINYEKFIGENLFGKIGILILVIGIGLFVKYAIDNEWINEKLRTVLGFVVGSALLFIAQRLHNSYRTFSSLLAGGAFATYYLVVGIAYHYYNLFSQTTSFIILIVITIFMSILSLLYNRRELAIVSLVGGFVVPFMVSSGSGNYVVLFSYIAILNVGMFILSLLKRWIELPIICFGATYLIMFLFASTRVIGVGLEAEALEVIARNLLIFATIYFLLFLFPIVSIVRNAKKVNYIELTTVVLNNFVYLAFGLTYLSYISSSIALDGILTLFIAIVNLILLFLLTRRTGNRTVLAYSVLGVVLSFVSLTIPLQLSGNYITLFWATEMVLLLWLYIKSKIRLYQYATIAMIACTLVSLLMDLYVVGGNSSDTLFFNKDFSSNLYAVLAFFAFAYVMNRYKTLFSEEKIISYKPWNASMIVAGILLGYVVFNEEYATHLDEIEARVMPLFTVAYMLFWSVVLIKRFPISRFNWPYSLALILATLVNVVCNPAWNAMPSLDWARFLVTIALFTWVSFQFYSVKRSSLQETKYYTLFISTLSVIMWELMAYHLASQLEIEQTSMVFSIALALIALIQMIIGMKLHIIALRIYSVGLFSIVILKLIAFDIWAMNSAGKIVVFILLGVILLSLSFLYQKLKNVLFTNENNDENNDEA